MDDDVGQEALLGGVVGVADQVGLFGGDVVGADNIPEDLDKSRFNHRSVSSSQLITR